MTRDELWPQDTLTLHARVRVVRASSENIRHVFPGGLAAEPWVAPFVETSPWVTRSFQVDLTQLPESWDF